MRSGRPLRRAGERQGVGAEYLAEPGGLRKAPGHQHGGCVASETQIVMPAALHGLIVERALPLRLVEEVSAGPGTLPLLSHALLQT